MIRTIVMAAAMLLATAGLSSAQDYQISYGAYANQVHDAYTWHDGYWWKSEVPYNRYTYKQSYYDNYNCLRYRYAYNYQAVPNYKKAETMYPDKDPEWRTKLLEIAKNRDLFEGHMRKSALAHNEFLESLDALGMTKNFRWNGYGYEPNYATGYHFSKGYEAEYYQQPAEQGSTVFGYKEVADIYGNVNLGEIYNNALRLRADSRSFEAEGDKGTTALVDRLGEHAAAVAEINAKGNAVATALRAAPSAEARAKFVKEVWSGRKATDVAVPPVEPGTPGGGTAVLQSAALRDAQEVADRRCVSCHNAKKPNGDLDLTDLQLVNEDQGRKILKRLISPDPNKRMPLSADLKPGEPLSEEETGAFFLAAYLGSSGKHGE